MGIWGDGEIKREQSLMSLTNFIEIDLLRKGQLMPMNLIDCCKPVPTNPNVHRLLFTINTNEVII